MKKWPKDQYAAGGQLNMRAPTLSREQRLWLKAAWKKAPSEKTMLRLIQISGRGREAILRAIQRDENRRDFKKISEIEWKWKNWYIVEGKGESRLFINKCYISTHPTPEAAAVAARRAEKRTGK